LRRQNATAVVNRPVASPRPETVRDRVRRLQVLLADRFGHRPVMPRTFATGAADGVWGGETTAAVRAFQQTHGVRPVGGWEAGHKTLLTMDRALSAPGPGPSPGPGPVPPVPSTPEIHVLPPSRFGGRACSEWRGRAPGGPGRGLGLRTGDAAAAHVSPTTRLVHAVSGADGTFSRSFSAVRRARGSYPVLARGITVEAATTFRFDPAPPVPLDPAKEKLYAHFLREATRMPRDANFGTPLSSDFEHDRFDKEFWEDADDWARPPSTLGTRASGSSCGRGTLPG
jgi:peptidoglycan hydrolase-like protein with peptidoglycan-binding domain